MITFTRTITAQPSKLFEMIAYLKETQTFVKTAVGLDPSINAVSGGVTGQFVSILTFNNFAHYEEVVTKLLANPGYQALVKKGEGIIVPGTGHDQLLRSL
jgi:hypothetical protein